MEQTCPSFALRCANVSKTFAVQREQRVWRILLGMERGGGGPVVEALRDISLTVPRGKIVGVLGRNGAGKSTLLRLLGQVYTPTTGRIEINGQVAGLFELGGMGNTNLTGREYATRYLQFMGVAGDSVADILEDIADFSELGDAFDQRIRTYSSGMASRLYFAVATAYQHEIYLIDELLSVGDEHFQAKCWRRMRERLLGGASGVLVTHDWTAIVKLCEQACVIDEGRFSFVGSSDSAVVRYLDLRVPPAESARFPDAIPPEFVLRSGEDSVIRLPVEILDDVAVDLAISVEMLRIGIGWEIVILSEYYPVADTAGNYTVEFRIPALPLAPGKYSLNLFLAQRPLPGMRPKTGLDCRSWTYGNGLTLRVEGKPFPAAVTLPFTVRPIPAELV
ncbi:MAG: ABC transporter ATP-binding protein [Accumulibacter sp.]|jgi:lipopolysaccharide transport system ATP-binding protein|uniref:ABC transporter ATP-binding protein n=1 Tax=Accumulibacter sp. TaxID=2053492 RepID=UPI002FC3DC08